LQEKKTCTASCSSFELRACVYVCKTWTGIRGAPGGDDYQNLWINPDNPNIILLDTPRA